MKASVHPTTHAMQEYLRRKLAARTIADLKSPGSDGVTAIIVSVDEQSGRSPCFRTDTFGLEGDLAAGRDMENAVSAMGKGDRIDAVELAADLLMTDLRTVAMLVRVRKANRLTLELCRHPDVEEEDAVAALHDAVGELREERKPSA